MERILIAGTNGVGLQNGLTEIDATGAVTLELDGVNLFEIALTAHAQIAVQTPAQAFIIDRASGEPVRSFSTVLSAYGGGALSVLSFPEGGGSAQYLNAYTESSDYQASYFIPTPVGAQTGVRALLAEGFQGVITTWLLTGTRLYFADANGNGSVVLAGGSVANFSDARHMAFVGDNSICVVGENGIHLVKDKELKLTGGGPEGTNPHYRRVHTLGTRLFVLGAEGSGDSGGNRIDEWSTAGECPNLCAQLRGIGGEGLGD